MSDGRAAADRGAELPQMLRGTVAVVTGGNRGIGLGIARVLGSAGATVCLWARDAETTEEAVASLTEEGISASGYRCDVTSESDVVQSADQVIEDFGALDIVVANAGTASNVPLVETTLEQWDHVVRTNLTSTFLCFREGARRMVARGRGGSLVAVASIAAVHGAPTMHHYAAAKSGLGGLVRSVAVELAPYRIRANTVLPGWTASDIHNRRQGDSRLFDETIASIPAGRWGTPEDVGRAVLYLADPSLSYHTGAELVVDGGYSKMPPYLAARFMTGRTGY
jgi:NAD(P)-dependent dehydrogenase (short-subunit alcohol dehydrogenase family)